VFLWRELSFQNFSTAGHRAILSACVDESLELQGQAIEKVIDTVKVKSVCVFGWLVWNLLIIRVHVS